METPYGHKVYAMAAEYPSAAALYEAAKRVRDAGFRRWDVYSPFPIHGMDEAMGLGKSWLSGWVLFGGISGLLTAALVQFGPVVDSLPSRLCTANRRAFSLCPRFSRSCSS